MRKPPLRERGPAPRRSLADVYLDGKRVHLMGDPSPRVSKILAAGGRRASGFQVLQGRSASDRGGKPLRPDDLVDRLVAPTTPIYLTSSPLRRKPGAADRDLAQASDRIPSVMVELPADDGEPQLRGPLPRGLDPDAGGPSPRNPLPSEDRPG